jgi:hypothetical protein
MQSKKEELKWQTVGRRHIGDIDVPWRATSFWANYVLCRALDIKTATS